MSTQEILRNLISRLYRESSTRFNFNINKYGNNFLVAEDGANLGKITDPHDPDSIFNWYGQYGGKYSPLSIFNKYGHYGGKYSPYSPFNKYTATPPKIFINGQYMGRLTMNKYLPEAIPSDLFLFNVLSEFGALETRTDELIDVISEYLD